MGIGITGTETFGFFRGITYSIFDPWKVHTAHSNHHNKLKTNYEKSDKQGELGEDNIKIARINNNKSDFQKFTFSLDEERSQIIKPQTSIPNRILL